MSKKKNFFQTLTLNATEAQRARAILYATQTLNSQKNLVGTLENKVSSIKIKMSNLLDLAPDNTQKIIPKEDQFNSVALVTELQSFSIELEEAEFALGVAKKNLEFFSFEPEKED